MQTVTDLRGRATRLREIAREFPEDEASKKLYELAAELDATADAADKLNNATAIH